MNYIDSYAALKKSIQRLSADSSEQILYLKQLNVYPLADELGLEFDDSYKIFKGAEQGKIIVSAEVMAKLDKLNYLLDQISGIDKVKLWNADSLNHTEWTEIRQIAREILACI